MRSRFFPYKKERDDTVLNYYALPLVGFNTRDFEDNFITTKVKNDGTVLFVQVKDDIYPDNIYNNKIIHGDKLFLSYDIPDEFLYDMLLIIKGMYSQLSSKAKHIIATKSGLWFNHQANNGEIYTSKLIFALHKDPELIKFIFESLKKGTGWEKHDKDLAKMLKNVELMEKVTKEDFIENI